MGIYRSTDPTTWGQVDGIIINESAPAPNVRGVPANIGILVGQTQRGLQALTEVGSIGQFHEMFGRSNAGVNKSLKNKKFGRLRVIRVVAADAVQASKQFSAAITFKAKQGKGAFGNNLQVKIEEASSSRQEIHTVLCVADVGDSLDAKYFVLRDKNGTVGFWIDVDDDGAVEPPHGADRDVEITTIVTGDSDSVVATKIAAAIEADSMFTASVNGATVTATSVDYVPGVGTVANGNSGFTVTRTQLGVYAGKKYTFHDNNLQAVVADESYDNVKIAEILPQTFAGSLLMEVTVQSAASEPANVAFTSLESGADGTVADSDYETAIALAAVQRAGNILFLDEYNSVRNGYLELHAAETQDKMVILCGPEAQTKSEALTDVDNYRDVDGRIIYAYPWVETQIDGMLVMTNPASWLASIITQTGPHVDPSFTDNSQYLVGITALKRSLTRSDYIELMSRGICAFERDEDVGFKVKSGIVTQIANSEKLTILRRRMADYLTDSAGRFLKNYQGAVNSKQNRDLAGAGIKAFVEGQIRDGILPKDSEVQGGLASQVDTESLNTNLSIGQGFFKILWRQRIYSSMRFIVLSAEIGENVVVTEQ